MLILKAKVLFYPFIQDSDGDWWIAYRGEGRGGKKVKYDLLEIYDDLIEDVKELHEKIPPDRDILVSRQHIKKNYGIEQETWDMQVIFESYAKEEH